MTETVDVGEVEALAWMPAERLEADVLAVAAQLAAGTCRFALLVGEFDRRRLYESWECRSTAHWLGWKVGIGLHAAREQVRVGRRLLELPVVRAAFAQGRLSYSKVRAITRVAVPGDEEGLVHLAEHATAAQVEQACGRLRRYADPLADETDLRDSERRGTERCHLSWSVDQDGHLVGSFRLDPVDGEVVRRALDGAAAALADAEPPEEGRSEPLERRRARALAALASAWLAGADDGAGAGPEVVVHVDVAALASLADTPPADVGAGTTDVPAGTSVHDPEWPVRTAGGARLSLGALERLLDDAGLRWVVDLPDGAQLDAAPHRRLPTAAQRRALRARDGHCRFPGCTSRARLRAHHIRWWTRGGSTTMSNLVMLCHEHHHAVHDRRWSCTGTADDLRWHRPGGTPVAPEPPALSGTLAELVTWFERHGIDVTSHPWGRWAGDHIDWDCFFAAFAPPAAPLPAT